MVRGFVIAALLASAACGPGQEEPQPFFPDDYELSYVEVRDCRPSGDHDLNNMRILADPVGTSSYQNRDANFPVGSIVLKEEYAFDDRDCTGAITQWTAMQRLEDGSASMALDWDWQRVDAERRIVGENTPRCFGCHTGCGAPPDGFDGTCAVP